MDSTFRPDLASNRRLIACVMAAVLVGMLPLVAGRGQSSSPSPASPAASSPAASATPAASPGSPAATSKEDLIAVAKSSGNFTTFLKIVEAAGLTATLQQAGTYTVFAPTDTAFTKLPTGKLDELLKPENKAKLVALVSYHLATTKLTAADLAKVDEVKTLEGTPIDVDVAADGKLIEVDDAKVLGSDLEASNGVLHSIDSVLEP